MWWLSLVLWSLSTRWLEAATLEDDGALITLNCATCTCIDKTSCVKACQDSGVGKGRVEPFYDLLKIIGSSCSVYAAVQVNSELGPKDYCVSTIDDRPGWVIAQPNIGSYGLGLLNADIVECWLRVWVDDSWSCDAGAQDGYHVYGAEVAPSPLFCGLPNLPAGLTLDPYETRQDTIRISLGYIDRTLRQVKYGLTQNTTLPHYKLNGHALVAVRYSATQRTDGKRCYGTFKKAAWVTSLKGTFFGTDHDITGYNL